MAKYIEKARKLFEALDGAKGWEMCKEFCVADATFSCVCLPHTRLDDYAQWMKGLKDGPLPDCRYEIKSETANDHEVTFIAIFFGTHTGEGLIPVSNPPKTTQCPYSYTFTFNDDGLCTSLYKVFDIFTAFSQLGWPLPSSS